MSSLGEPADERPDPFDAAGKWLAACYQLASRDRERVKDATVGGRPVSDPRLQEAVRGLSCEILANRLRTPGIVGHYVVGVAGGIMAFAVALNSSWPHGHHQLIAILAVVAAVNHVIVYFVLLPRRMRKKVAKALRVNSGTEALPDAGT